MTGTTTAPAGLLRCLAHLAVPLWFIAGFNKPQGSQRKGNASPAEKAPTRDVCL